MRKKHAFSECGHKVHPSQDVVKRPSRRDREQKILIELVEHYIKTGRPVGSHTLQGESILDVSSATIRNYFASLEEAGYLKQQHTSGGRIPQPRAYSVYADHCLEELKRQWIDPEKQSSGLSSLDKEQPCFQEGLFENLEPTELVSSIQSLTSKMSNAMNLAAVTSAPRFDRDSVVDIRYVYIDANRLLSVVITEFGLIHSTVLSIEGITLGIVKKAERFSRMRLFQETIDGISFDAAEMELARSIYQETMSSYFVMYSSASHEDIFKAGFSNLFSHPDFQDGTALKPAISLFENSAMLRGLLREAIRSNSIRYWIGGDLDPYCSFGPVEVALIAVPYHVADKPVGALSVIGPMRMAYKEVFQSLQKVSHMLSQHLTKTLVKHRITFRMPNVGPIRFDAKEVFALEFRDED